jgi:hypothetical protein
MYFGSLPPASPISLDEAEQLAEALFSSKPKRKASR